MVSDSLEGDSWTKRTARVGFPILVEYAMRRRPITYGDWDAELVKRKLGKHVMLTQYGKPAGAIGDACEEYSERFRIPVPMINLMVINKNTGMPGEGANYYIKHFSQHFLNRSVNPGSLSPRDRLAIIERAFEEIFDFGDWSKVLHVYSLAEPAKISKKPAGKKQRRHPNPTKWHTGPESPAHKELKSRIAATPSLVGLPDSAKGQKEIRLWSGDKVDVSFSKHAVAVEVKTATGFDELHRGIFQCVKYKAILRAQQLHDRQIPSADCILAVGGKLPVELQEVARLLGVLTFDQLNE